MGENLITVSKVFLIVVNAIMALVSLGILGGGLYVYLNYAIFEPFLSQEAVLYIASSGAIVFLFCLLGLLGAICNQPKFLIPYLVVIVLFIAAEVLIGIVGLNYLGVLDNTVFDIGQNNTLDPTEVIINNFILKAYHTCCVANPLFCSTTITDPNFCRDVLFCDVVIPPPCIEEDPGTGSKIVDQVVCSTLTGFNLESGGAIVGPAPGSCGGGDPETFVNTLVDIVKSQLEIAGYAAIGLGVLEILIVLFTTYLIFRGADAGRIRRAFTGNFAVAVAEPVAVRPGEQIRQSVPLNNEEFEVDMSTIGSRSTSHRSVQRRPMGGGKGDVEF